MSSCNFHPAFAFAMCFVVDLARAWQVGDVSFLHDINGLNLLRVSPARPPLTVVLINNGGGSIFSFLPAADQIPEDAFSQLWTTPQHVDLMGALCTCKQLSSSMQAAICTLEGLCHSSKHLEIFRGVQQRSSSVGSRLYHSGLLYSSHPNLVFSFCSHVPGAWHCAPGGAYV